MARAGKRRCILLNTPQLREKPSAHRSLGVFTRRQSSLRGADDFILALEAGLTMVKVTFNSALAQKELKKGEKDEALIPQEGVS